jgi:cytochrome c-type biogenesis protein CcmF
MNEILGTATLALAVLVACATIVVSLAAARFASRTALVVSKVGIGLFAALLTLASIILLAAMADSDFTLDYVVRYTELALPMGYKLAAFWAGQEGSLLLWAWMLAVMGVVTALTHRPRSVASGAYVMMGLMIVSGFFAALMLFAANPFAPTPVPVADGRGLNPMLQDPGMLAHPPLLFLGYAGCTIPFALLFGALLAPQRQEGKTSIQMSLPEVRNWTLFSWLFLTIGIILGAQWAYVELGWGGYWAWDPVENASLLPWLTGTALLHSIIVQQHRGMLKIWNAALIAVTFILCIFGTYLTRSGVVQSVHGFGESLVGDFFLIFLIALLLGSAILISVRGRLLQSERPLENLLGREGAFLIVNVLLVLMTLVTIVGTIFPVISRVFSGNAVSVDQSFYNRFVVPMGMLLVALMACGPLLTYGAGAGARLGKGMLIPGVAALLAAGGVALAGYPNPWAILTAAIVAAAVVAALMEFIRAVTDRAAHENVLVAALRVLDANHRRYGGQMAHLGVLMLVVGVAGSSLYSVKETFQLSKGETAQLGRYEMTFRSIDDVKGPNFDAVVLTLDLKAPGEPVKVLRPERRFYKNQQSSAEVAIRYSLREDLYATLAGWEDGGKKVAVQAIINPLVNWMWIGGIVMSVGAIFCLLPRFSKADALVEAEVAAEASA